MGMTKDGGYSLERGIIRLGGAFALLVILLWAGVLLYPSSGFALDGDLSTIRYRRLGEEQEAIGQLTVSENGLVSIRLFSEGLAQHYVLHIEPSELLGVERLPSHQAKAIMEVRGDLIAEKKRQREAARLEREARRAREAETIRATAAKIGRSSRRTARHDLPQAATQAKKGGMLKSITYFSPKALCSVSSPHAPADYTTVPLLSSLPLITPN